MYIILTHRWQPHTPCPQRARAGGAEGNLLLAAAAVSWAVSLSAQTANPVIAFWESPRCGRGNKPRLCRLRPPFKKSTRANLHSPVGGYVCRRRPRCSRRLGGAR